MSFTMSATTLSFGMPRSFGSSFWITLIFLSISVARAYLVRRFFAAHLQRFAAWCQEIRDDFKALSQLT